MDDKERFEFLLGDIGGAGADRSPEQLPAAGKIANGQEVRVESVDGGPRAMEVDGPDGAGPSPVENMNRLIVEAAPDAAIALQDVLEFGAGDGGEDLSQAGQADARSEFVDALEDLVALFAGRCPDGATERLRRQEVVSEIESPIAEGPLRQAEPGGDFGPVPTFLKELLADEDRMPAHGLLAFPFETLASEATAGRTFSHRFGSPFFTQVIHDGFFDVGDAGRVVVFF